MDASDNFRDSRHCPAARCQGLHAGVKMPGYERAPDRGTQPRNLTHYLRVNPQRRTRDRKAASVFNFGAVDPLSHGRGSFKPPLRRACELQTPFPTAM